MALIEIELLANTFENLTSFILTKSPIPAPSFGLLVHHEEMALPYLRGRVRGSVARRVDEGARGFAQGDLRRR
jgi:hypothetical protein